MASLFKHRNSPFWQLRYKNSAGQWRLKSTMCRIGVSTETRKAEEMRAKHTLEEVSRAPQTQRWDSWVPAFLEGRYDQKPASYVSATKAWRMLNKFFQEKKIDAPPQLKREDCHEYLAWRTKRKDISNRKKPASHNTARLELKYLGVICHEAYERNLISRNPALRLGIPKHKPAVQRPELNDEFINKIWFKLRSEPVWMRYAFEIAINLGCRLTETAVFTSDVNLQREQVHFRKNKTDVPFTAPIPPTLLPLFNKLSAAGGERIFDLPADAARQWHRFFKETGLSAELAGVCFHSTRVTVVTRMARNPNVKSDMARAAVNHSSELVHRSYQRWQPRDVAVAFCGLHIPAPDDSSPSSESQG